MYHYSISATTNCEKAIAGEIRLTRQQMVDRMQTMRAMTRHDDQTYIMTITHESDDDGGNYVWRYIIHDGVEDKTLLPPTYYGFWRKRRLV